jgi:hypothetical protein
LGILNWVKPLYVINCMIGNKYKPKFDQLIWYDKTLIALAAAGILVSLYVYACTCSLGNVETIKQLGPYFIVIKSIDYVAILMIVIGLVFNKERVLQFQQLLGLVILGSVIIVAMLYFLPCSVNEAKVGTIKYSLFCPQYSIISWLNLFWFGAIGLANFAIPLFMRKK